MDNNDIEREEMLREEELRQREMEDTAAVIANSNDNVDKNKPSDDKSNGVVITSRGDELVKNDMATAKKRAEKRVESKQTSTGNSTSIFDAIPGKFKRTLVASAFADAVIQHKLKKAHEQMNNYKGTDPKDLSVGAILNRHRAEQAKNKAARYEKFLQTFRTAGMAFSNMAHVIGMRARTEATAGLATSKGSTSGASRSALDGIGFSHDVDKEDYTEDVYDSMGEGPGEEPEVV